MCCMQVPMPSQATHCLLPGHGVMLHEGSMAAPSSRQRLAQQFGVIPWKLRVLPTL